MKHFLLVLIANYCNLKVEKIDLRAYLQVNETALESQNVNPVVLNLQKFIGPAPTGADPDYEPSVTPEIGFSHYPAVIFPARRNISLPMIFTFLYTPDPMVGLIKDPAFAEMLNVCGVLGVKRPARIGYSASTTVSTLRNLGYIPKVDGNIGINCPVSPEQISAFQSAVQVEGQEPITALQSIFNGSG